MCIVDGHKGEVKGEWDWDKVCNEGNGAGMMGTALGWLIRSHGIWDNGYSSRHPGCFFCVWAV